jgi:hypothetical protein
MNPDIDEGMIASGETTNGPWIRTAPTPYSSHTALRDHKQRLSPCHHLRNNPPGPPPLLVDADRSRLRLFDVDTVTSQTYPVATSKSIRPPFIGWVRSLTDAHFANEEWGDSHMMPVEGQAKMLSLCGPLASAQRESD